MTGIDDPHPWTVEMLRIYTQGQLTQLRGDMVALRREIAASAEANATARAALLGQVERRFAEMEASLGRIGTGLEDAHVRLTSAEGRATGASTLWAHIVAGVGLLFAIIAVILAYSNSQQTPPLPPEGAGMIVVGSVYSAPDIPRTSPLGTSLDRVNAPSPLEVESRCPPDPPCVWG